MERKLAAVLAADVAGYSRLTALDEEGTLRVLSGYRTAIAGFISEHAGRIFGSAGDSIVAEFASPVQAVRCAVAIQRSMNRRNADLPQDRRLEFRIGINLGDIVVAESDLLGDGVNVAARLQEIAAPGGICITGNIREQLEGKTSFPLASLGERSLKNIPRPVSVFRVDWTPEDPGRTGVLGGAPSLPDKPSIAVLPFANMSGDPEQEFFADGITEDIIIALSRNRWFFVIARNSSFAYKGPNIDVKQVGRELGVRYVLEGSVRRAGNRVRVTGQLIEAETGAHIWAERYDRDYADIFAIQDEITESVVGAIEPELLMGEGRRAARRGAGNLDAFECSMRGLWHHYQFAAPEDLREAERWLRRAIELDPKFARAHMGLARTIFARCLFGWSTAIDGDLATMAAAAERAVALDDRDPYCHYALFASSLSSGRLALALSEAQHTIDLNPNFALGHLALGSVRIFIGHFAEAMEPLLRALRLSPHDPIAFMFLIRMALAQYHLENYEEALHYSQRALVGRRLYFVLVIALASLGRLGRSDEARQLLAEISAIVPPDLGRYWDVTFPYANAAHREYFYEGLRRAGMHI